MQIDNLHIHIFSSRQEMGKAAAHDFGRAVRTLLSGQEKVRTIFAAAPSQNEFLENLIAEPDIIDWQRVTAFHMDEYIGLPKGHRAGLGDFLKARLFEKLPFGEVHYLDGNTEGVQAECERYSDLLKAAPIDLVALGIGENGHLAFNDPPVADFNDSTWVKVVEMDEISRQQQVNDGAFDEINEVPKTAMTLTMPALLSACHLSCVVPGQQKRAAVTAALFGEISTACPASILRRHQQAVLYLNKDAAPEQLSKSVRFSKSNRFE